MNSLGRLHANVGGFSYQYEQKRTKFIKKKSMKIWTHEKMFIPLRRSKIFYG